MQIRCLTILAKLETHVNQLPSDTVQAGSVEADYIERTNAALDYIVKNLDGELNLEKIAEVACFSPFHFHRVFRSLLGETLNQFVKTPTP